MNDIQKTLSSLLPYPVFSLIQEDTEELRFRLNCPVLMKNHDKTMQSHLICTKELFDEILSNLLSKSFYKYEDTINQGYIPVENGIRAGVVGRAISDQGKILRIQDVSFIALRIPHIHIGIADPFYRKMKEGQFKKSALIFSLPGVGKTTVLREFSRKTSSFLNTALIDERGELSPTLENCPMLTVYLFYPKTSAISMALRTVAPDLMVLDEIGSEECKELSLHIQGGVPIFASAHASSIEELSRNQIYQPLIHSGIFSYFVRIQRIGKTVHYTFYNDSFHKEEERTS